MNDMRLIDADALKADLIESKEKLWEIYNGLSDHIDKQICGGQIASFMEAILRIKDAPAIDAVPVVRCKDCKHFYREQCYHTRHDHHTQAIKQMLDDFCSYGERKDGEG